MHPHKGIPIIRLGGKIPRKNVSLIINKHLDLNGLLSD